MQFNTQVLKVFCSIFFLTNTRANAKAVGNDSYNNSNSTNNNTPIPLLISTDVALGLGGVHAVMFPYYAASAIDCDDGLTVAM
eukprot:Pgem_evm1s13860